ncbi:hypothetical protein B9Z55_009741 [Caenorhabditis nigoni]|uniref:F-box domain-containing protein n=1 Tax=Caenorhabditis nigoni TaxID=1611254 RepID=A0A2G5UTB4_9PELO|nr:hypothetical protein B9Z55_009741 [Caenorhabditis nigoni]
MPRKSTGKSVVSVPKTESFKFISLSDIEGTLILKTKEGDEETVCCRGDSESSQDCRKILKEFFDVLDSKQVDQLRLFGIKHRMFNLYRSYKTEFAVASILFDQSTDLQVLYDIIPKCSILKHVTLKGATKYPCEKRHYIVRVHYSEAIPFDEMDFVHIRQSIFTKDPENPIDLKSFPKKILLKPFRYDTEIFVRYHLTPVGLANLISSIASQGNCFYQNEWLVYKMNRNCQLFCKIGINGVYCVVLPAGSESIPSTPLERFVWNNDEVEVAQLLSTPEEEKDRKKSPIGWNCLPDKIKLLCIDRMHFKTRIHLRSTCHAEKKLVDSSKPYAFKFVKVEHLTYTDGSQTMSVVAQNPKETLNIRSERWAEPGKHDAEASFDLVLSAVKNILHFCEIEALCLYPGAKEGGMKQLQDELKDIVPFKISTFFSIVLNPEIQFFFIENCNVDPNMVFLRVTKHFTPKKYLDAPKILNSKCLQLQLDKPGVDLSGALFMITTKWLAMDIEIDKKVVISVPERYFKPEMEVLAKKLSKRVISQTDEYVLVRTIDEAKNILVFDYNDYTGVSYICFRVISSKMKESEYGLYDRPWLEDCEVIGDFEECDEEEEYEYDPSS